VKNFSPQRGFGFIEWEGQEVFLHKSVCMDGVPMLGDQVTFDMYEDKLIHPGTLKATNVYGCTGTLADIGVIIDTPMSAESGDPGRGKEGGKGKGKDSGVKGKDSGVKGKDSGVKGKESGAGKGGLAGGPSRAAHLSRPGPSERGAAPVNVFGDKGGRDGGGKGGSNNIPLRGGKENRGGKGDAGGSRGRDAPAQPRHAPPQPRQKPDLSSITNLHDLELQLTEVANTLYDFVLDMNVPVRNLESTWEQALALREDVLVAYGMNPEEQSGGGGEGQDPNPDLDLYDQGWADDDDAGPAPPQRRRQPERQLERHPPERQPERPHKPGSYSALREERAAALGMTKAQYTHYAQKKSKQMKRMNDDGAAEKAKVDDMPTFKAKLQYMLCRKLRRPTTKDDHVYSVHEVEDSEPRMWFGIVRSQHFVQEEYMSLDPSNNRRLAENAAALEALKGEFPDQVDPDAVAELIEGPPVKKQNIGGPRIAEGEGPRGKLNHCLQLLMGRSARKGEVEFAQLPTPAGRGAPGFRLKLTLPSAIRTKSYYSKKHPSLKQAEADCCEQVFRELADDIEKAEAEAAERKRVQKAAQQEKRESRGMTDIERAAKEVEDAWAEAGVAGDLDDTPGLEENPEEMV